VTAVARPGSAANAGQNVSTGRAAGIVLAAGQGERLGGGIPKALRRLGDRPLVEYAAGSLAAAGLSPIVVTAPEDRLADMRAAVAGVTAAVGVAAEIVVVPGGVTRQDSVAVALDLLPTDVRWVLVHDAARALAPAELAVAVLDVLRAGAAAAIPGLAVVDTVKEVAGGEAAAPGHGAGTVVRRTLDRRRLVAVQTPQGFEVELLRRAHAASPVPPGVDATGGSPDDAALVEALGVEVRVVPGSPEALKITRPQDLAVAELLLADRGVARSAVTGTGAANGAGASAAGSGAGS